MNSLLERVRAAPTRSKVLLGLIIAIALLGLTGRLSAGNGIEITSDEAVQIARPLVDFEPESSEALLIRQGFNLRPVWAVSFSVRTPGGDRNDFDHLMIVNVDAVDGEIIATSDGQGEPVGDG